VALATVGEGSGSATVGAGLPRFRVGRLGSSSSFCSGVMDGGEAGAVDAEAGGAGAAGELAVEAGWLGSGVCVGVADGGVSGGLGFEAAECRRVGGPLSSSNPRGIVGDGFLLDLAASDSAVCHVPSAIHSFVF